MPLPRPPLRAKIITAEDFHPAPEGLNVSPAARTLVWHSEVFKAQPSNPNPPPIPEIEGNTDHTIEITPIVSTGRWCAQCPWCPASEYPSSTQPFFMCSQCHNNGSFVWVVVKWPDRRWEIEEILSLRPVPQTRNWLPHETPEYLALENEMMGVKGTFEHMNYRRPDGLDDT